jgi:hypothetical protein
MELIELGEDRSVPATGTCGGDTVVNAGSTAAKEIETMERSGRCVSPPGTRRKS